MLGVGSWLMFCVEWRGGGDSGPWKGRGGEGEEGGKRRISYRFDMSTGIPHI